MPDAGVGVGVDEEVEDGVKEVVCGSKVSVIVADSVIV